jgi:hypothetical protein
MQNALTLAPVDRASSDFNDDGFSDIVFRANTGDVSFFYGSLTGGFTAGPTLYWNPASTIVGIGDFNGDAREDILFSGGYSDANGTLLLSALRTISVGFQPDWEAATLVPTGWLIIGTGDFNGDGKTDILLRNADGTITDWLAARADSTIVDVPNAPFANNGDNSWVSVPISSNIVGAGDFNGDGRTDILLRNANGTIFNFLGTANGGFVNNGDNSSVTLAASWLVAAIGDFNGDGLSDILWRSDSGAIFDFLGTANGGFVNNGDASWVSVDNSWHVAGVGKFNGDARDDILWRNDSGAIFDFLGIANGGFINNGDSSWMSVDYSWQVQPNPSGSGIWDY